MIPTGNIYDSGNFQKVLSEAQTMFDFDVWRVKASAMRAQGRFVGVGLATCMERNVYDPTEWWSLNNTETPGFTLTSTPEGITLRLDLSDKMFVTLNSPMPTANEMPRNFKLGHVETPSPFTEYGIKGGGEGGRLGAPSALTSAIKDALSDRGVKTASLPITPPILRGLIRAAEQAAASQEPKCRNVVPSS